VRSVFGISCFLCFWILSTNCCALPSDRSDESKKLLQDAQQADARSLGGGAFRLRANFVTERKGQMVGDGSYELLWASQTKWREEILTSDFSQVRVGGDGGIWEDRRPPYQSLRVWQLTQALAFASRFSLWRNERIGTIKIKKHNGIAVRCVETRLDVGEMRELCFDEKTTELVSEHYIPSDRTYEFTEYSSIGAKQFPRHIKIYDGKTLAVEFSATDIQEAPNLAANSFEIPASAKWRNWCPNPEPAIPLRPAIYSASFSPSGHVTVFGALGTDGVWNLHILESGGRAADAYVLDTEGKARFKPATCNGVPVMVETAFRR